MNDDLHQNLVILPINVGARPVPPSQFPCAASSCRPSIAEAQDIRTNMTYDTAGPADVVRPNVIIEDGKPLG